MAGYSENREHNLEIKYLRKVLGDVDGGITLPEALKAENLVGSLAGVRQNAPAMRETLLHPRSFLNMRSGLAYAAAFVLIVGLFYTLGYNKQDHLVGGAIALEPGQSRVQTQQSADLSSQPEILSSSAPESLAESFAPSSPAQEAAPFAVTLAPLQENDEPSEPEALGGIISTQVGEFGDYLLAYRPADPSDPESGAANALEILDPEENALVSRVELPFMTRVFHAFAGESVLAVVGQDEENVYLLSLDLSVPEEPKTVELLSQPGRLSAARDFEGVVHVISYSAGVVQGDCEVIALPDSGETGMATLTALSLDDGAFNRVAFSGAGEEIKLFGVNAYLYYDGVSAEEDGEPKEDFFIAQVKLSGLNMELGGIS